MNKYYMSDEDFNTFLEDIGGLTNGFLLNAKPITERDFFTVSNNWLGLIKTLIEDLIKLDWNKEICQVKEKWGGLRFYTNELCDEGHKLIKIAETLIYEIKDKPICTCICHFKSSHVMHYMACCEHTYEKYINKDDTIDQEALDKLNNKD